ncbi:MAG: hypothetical protein O2931_08995 [Planctomycetota bacterium]|nr:hypothetical protein [Planctomycetota bacterium]MDA1178919.1 hypothetical protein [Planctomycetota bacterium]
MPISPASRIIQKIAFVVALFFIAIATNPLCCADDAAKANETAKPDDAAKAVPSAEAEAAIAKIKELGGTVSQIAANSSEREVSFHLSDKEIGDSALEPLAQLPEIIAVNLRGTKVTDQGLLHLGKLSKLRRLHLEKTGITDAGLAALKGLAELEYLNLYGTGVTDEGLAHLEGLAKLKKVYLWQSKVTDAGSQQLIAKIPGLQVNLGAELKPVEFKPAIETLAEGQFIRVRRTGTAQVLSLAEVEVLATDELKPLQKEGKASQSTTAEGAAAERAIDGNVEPDFTKGSVTQTESQNYPWWLLDLTAPKPIAQIKIHSRGDAVGTVIGSVVEILDANKQVVWSAEIKEGKDGQIFEFPTK